MRHGALFNGIAGFMLAASWMGWENIFSVEIDEFCNKVSKKHFPNAIQYGDIREFDGTKYRGAVDVLSGGFPCQPYSAAGKRKGTADDRHLWPEMLRTIREVQPGYVVGENVRGLTNWSGGLVFDQVQADLEAEGFEVLPFLLPACAVNAPHRRDRIWFVAYNKGFGCKGERPEFNQWREQEPHNRREIWNYPATISKSGLASNPEYQRCKEQWDQGAFRSSPTVPSIRGRVESGFRGGNDGFSSRVDRIKALGNAIVPQVAFELFKAIQHSKDLK